MAEIRKPTSHTDPSSRWANEANAYDNPTVGGDETTRTDSGANFAAASETGTIGFSGFAAASDTYSALTLNAKWSTNDTSGNDTWSIEYSLDGGVNWGNFLLAQGTNRSVAVQTESVNLDAGQDLTALRVRVNMTKVGGADGKTIYLYDVWTEGEIFIPPQDIDVGDLGVLSDSIPDLSAAIPVSDSASVSASADISVEVGVGDLWNFTEGLQVDTGEPQESDIGVGDSGAVLEGAEVGADVSASDSGYYIEFAQVGASVELSDISELTETPGIGAAVQASDEATLGETESVGAESSIFESINFGEAVIAVAEVPVSDSWSFGDAVSVDTGEAPDTPVAIGDALTAEFEVAAVAVLELSDSWFFDDSVSLHKTGKGVPKRQRISLNGEGEGTVRLQGGGAARIHISRRP